MATFKKAVKTASKLRMAVSGPAGSGKTFTALTLAEALRQGKPVAVIDTERGSASKYADIFDFDVLELESFHPERYIEAIQAAVAEGYGVIIVDSLTHAWNGKDGLLELVEAIGKRKYGGNSFKAWGDVKALENRFVEALTATPAHIIATMRSKTEYVVEKDERGKSAPRKVGTAPVQRDGFEYEFDIFGEMTADNELVIQKTRCQALTGKVILRPDAALAETLLAWLADGAAAPAPVSPPAPEQPAARRQPHAAPPPPPARTAQPPKPTPTANGSPLTVQALFERAKRMKLAQPEWMRLKREAGTNLEMLSAALDDIEFEASAEGIAEEDAARAERAGLNDAPAQNASADDADIIFEIEDTADGDADGEPKLEHDLHDLAVPGARH